MIDDDENDDQMGLRVSHNAAFQSFKESMNKIEEPFIKRINELEEELKVLQRSKEEDKRTIEALESALGAQTHAVKDLSNYIGVLKKQQKDYAPVATSLSVGSMQNVKGSSRPSQEEFNALQKKYKKATLQLESLKKPQQAMLGRNNENVAQPIDFTKLEHLTGDNAGFLKGPLGNLRMLDGMACKDYVILRENRTFQFEHVSSDQNVKIEGTTRFQREVVEQADGYKSKHVIVKREGSVREGEKDYTVFDVARCFYL